MRAGIYLTRYRLSLRAMQIKLWMSSDSIGWFWGPEAAFGALPGTLFQPPCLMGHRDIQATYGCTLDAIHPSLYTFALQRHHVSKTDRALSGQSFTCLSAVDYDHGFSYIQIIFGSHFFEPLSTLDRHCILQYHFLKIGKYIFSLFYNHMYNKIAITLIFIYTDRPDIQNNIIVCAFCNRDFIYSTETVQILQLFI